MELKIVKIEKPEEINFILGQSHFIKTVEDIHEAVVQTNSQMKFGLGFCESSGAALVRYTGNDAAMIELAKKNALNTIKNVPEVCRIYCATANPVEVVVAETEQGRGILGVIDGVKTKGIEAEADIKWRKELLRKFGYKLG
jgi:adenosine/AMP kinase